MYSEKTISTALMKLGIPPYTKGYLYLLKASELYKNMLDFSKTIYPKIAHSYHVTPMSVERAIRIAIHNGYAHRDVDFANNIFYNTLQCKSDIPTNALFISALHEWARLNPDC